MTKLFQSLKLLSLVAIASFFVSCDDEATVDSQSSSTFDYELSDLVGIWQATEMQSDSSSPWYTINDTSSDYYLFYFDIRFKDDYTYELTGTTSSESGNFTAKGSVVSTYETGVLKGEYDIQSLADDQMEIILVKGTAATNYRLSKRW